MCDVCPADLPPFQRMVLALIFALYIPTVWGGVIAGLAWTFREFYLFSVGQTGMAAIMKGWSMVLFCLSVLFSTKAVFKSWHCVTMFLEVALLNGSPFFKWLTSGFRFFVRPWWQ